MNITNSQIFFKTPINTNLLQKGNISFGQKNCPYESDSFQSEINKPAPSATSVVLNEIANSQTGKKADVIEEIALTFENNNFLEPAKTLYEKSLEMKNSQNAPKKSLIDSYVHLQRIHEKLGQPESRKYKLLLDKEVNNA